MTNNSYKLFATDMDGTFLRPTRDYDKARLSADLKIFAEKNLTFCAASGRQMLALETLFADFKNQMAFVAENGAFVSLRGKRIFAKTLTKEQQKELIALLQNNPYMQGDKILLSGAKGAYVLATTADEFFEKTQIYYENVSRVASVDAIDDEIFKVTTNFEHEFTEGLEKELNAQIPWIHATTTGFHSIDLIPAGVDKAVGLAALADSLGLKASNVVAFGDQSNDLEMMAYAGLPIAVDNAIDAVKKLSARVIGSNADDAVLEEIEELIK